MHTPSKFHTVDRQSFIYTSVAQNCAFVLVMLAPLHAHWAARCLSSCVAQRLEAPSTAGLVAERKLQVFKPQFAVRPADN